MLYNWQELPSLTTIKIESYGSLEQGDIYYFLALPCSIKSKNNEITLEITNFPFPITDMKGNSVWITGFHGLEKKDKDGFFEPPWSKAYRYFNPGKGILRKEPLSCYKSIIDSAKIGNNIRTAIFRRIPYCIASDHYIGIDPTFRYAIRRFLPKLEGIIYFAGQDNLQLLRLSDYLQIEGPWEYKDYAIPRENK